MGNTRELFEDWAKAQRLDLAQGECRFGETMYTSAETDAAWEAWQAQAEVIEVLKQQFASVSQEDIELFNRIRVRRLRRSQNAKQIQLQKLAEGDQRRSDMLALYHANHTMQEIADKYGVVKSTVSRILRGEILRKREPILAPSDSVNVDALGLDILTLRCLKDAGILTASQLACESKNSLLRLPHFGSRSLKRVKEALSTRGIDAPYL